MADRFGLREETLRLYDFDHMPIKFWWAFEYDGAIYIDSGSVGDEGDRQTFKESEIELVNSMAEKQLAAGFREVEEDDYVTVGVQFEVEGTFASPSELDYRNELWDELDAMLAFTGQGLVVGGESGEGVMELFLAVVDDEMALRTLKDFFANNPSDRTWKTITYED